MDAEHGAQRTCRERQRNEYFCHNCCCLGIVRLFWAQDTSGINSNNMATHAILRAVNHPATFMQTCTPDQLLGTLVCCLWAFIMRGTTKRWYSWCKGRCTL